MSREPSTDPGAVERPENAPDPESPRATRPGAERPGDGLGEFASMLSRRRWIWLPLSLLVLAISAFTYVTSPVLYRSSTKVLVSRGERESSLNPKVRYLRWEEELGSEVETVFSQPVLEFAETMLRDAGIRRDDGEAVGLESSDISATPVHGSNVLEILFQDEDPDIAREGVRAITEAYMGYRRATRTAPEVEHFFRDRLDNVETRLIELADRRKDLLQGAGIAQLTEQRQELLRLQHKVRSSLVTVREEVAYAEARVRALRKFRDSGLSDISYIPVFATIEQRNDVGMRRLVDEMVGLQSRRVEFESKFTEEHPYVIEVRERIAAQRSLMDEAAQRYESVLDAQLDTWRARERQLDRELETIDAELSNYPAREAELGQVQLHLEVEEDNYRRLMAEFTSADIQNASAPNWQVRLYGDPSRPVRVHTGDLIRTLVIPIFALVVGIGLALIVDGVDPSVKTAGEAERIFGAPVLATVGRIGRK